MIRAEFRKLLAHWQLLLLISVLIAANAGLILWRTLTPGEEGYSPRDVGRVYAAMGEDQAGYVRDRIDTLSDRDYIRSLPVEEYENVIAELNLLRHIAEEIDQAAAYGDYLAGIESEAKRMEGASLLFRPDSFSARNITDLAQEYTHLSRSPLAWSPSEGMLLVTDNTVTDLCVLLCIMMLVLLLTTSERAAGFHPLLRSAPEGCRKSWLGKGITLGISTLGLLVLFYLPGLLIAGNRVGFGVLGQPVQSMAAYYSCPYALTTGQFLVWYFVAKALALLGIATVLYCCGCFFSGSLSAVVGMGALLGVSWITWLSVDRLSWYGMLKECSLAALVSTHHYFESAYNVNAAGYPVSSVTTGAVFLGLCLGAAVPLSAFFWNRPTQVDRKWFRRRRRKAVPIRARSLGMLELHKLLVTNRAALITIAAVLLLILGTSGPKGFDQTQYFYRQYAEMLSGELTEDTRRILDEEAARFADADRQIALLSEKLVAGEISAEAFNLIKTQWEIPYAQLTAYDMARSQYDYLLKLQSEGVPVAFLDETGWRHMTGDWGTGRSILNAVWTAVVLALCLYNFGTMENTSGMHALIACVPDEWRRVLHRKRLCAGCFAALIAPIPYVHQLILANSAFALDGVWEFSLSAASIQCIGASAWCPMGGYFALRFLSVSAEAVAASLLILECSRRIRQNVVSLFGCLTILGLGLGLSVVLDISPILAGRIHTEALIVEVLIFLLVLCGAFWLQKRKKLH